MIMSQKSSAGTANETSSTVTHEPISMSTTKALLLSIAVPRVVRIYVPPKQSKKFRERQLSQPNGLSDIAGSSGAMIPSNDEPRISEDRILQLEITTRRESTTMTEHEVGYFEHEEREERGFLSGILEDIITVEEMATIVKIQLNEESAFPQTTTANGGFQNQELVAEKPKEADPKNFSTDSATFLAASVAPKWAESFHNWFGVIEEEADAAPKVYMTQSEAVAALKAHDPLPLEPEREDVLTPNTEIRLEELVRLTFWNLYMEGHFYNAPLYTAVQSRIKDKEPDDWVEVAVMAKNASTGIILERLERIGVGSSVGIISIYKAELCKTLDNVEEVNKLTEMVSGTRTLDSSAPGSDCSVTDRNARIEAARAEWKNAASRLRVEQVKEQISEQAQLSFDFLALVTIASILAGIGLITNNAVIIVASMLVSPIMGPVMGMTFGGRVLDWNLTCWSLKNECVSLAICVVVGGIIGFSTSRTPAAATWPTGEMSSRGDVTGLLAGIAIAIPSGMGVALSILGNNTSSLVGVAISASLLPPAVNAGICWAHAILIRTGATEIDGKNDFAVIGIISLVLTIVNIICIWISGIFMFYLKEVAPSKAKSAFWSRDIKVARAMQQGSNTALHMDVLKAGLQDALDKEKKRKEAKENGSESPPAPPPTQPSQKTKKKMHRERSQINFNLASNGVDDYDDVDVENYIGTSPLTKEIKSLRMNDMFCLLGVDEEDEEESNQNGFLGILGWRK